MSTPARHRPKGSGINPWEMDDESPAKLVQDSMLKDWFYSFMPNTFGRLATVKSGIILTLN